MKFSRILYICSLAVLLWLSGCGGSDSFNRVVFGDDSEGDPQEASNPHAPLSDAEWRDGNYIDFDSAFSINPKSNLPLIFNDSNKYQYAAAERIGIDPIQGVSDAYFTRRPLHRIASCKNYHLDVLTHSMPYLVPEADQLLNEIGSRFNERVKKISPVPHRIRVTSVLRSGYAVKKLKKVNTNATDSSTHQLATTFDISYAHFDCDNPARAIPDEQLKYILADVLLSLRKEKKCMVKFEKKSPCFHISATGR